MHNFNWSISGDLIQIICKRRNFFYLENSCSLSLSHFVLLQIRLFCEVVGRILIVVFSFEPENGFFKQKHMWVYGLLPGAAMPGAVV